jgi:hypothetical protein
MVAYRELPGLLQGLMRYITQTYGRRLRNEGVHDVASVMAANKVTMDRGYEQIRWPPIVHQFLDSIETQIDRLYLWYVVSLLLINASLT